jgi:hypothetical protein
LHPSGAGLKTALLGQLESAALTTPRPCPHSLG